MSLRRLGVDRIDLLQAASHRSAGAVGRPVGELKAMQDEGKIAALGLSRSSVDEIEQAREIADIVTVQNLHNLVHRESQQYSTTARSRPSDSSRGSRSRAAGWLGRAVRSTTSFGPRPRRPPRSRWPGYRDLAGRAADSRTSKVAHLEENVAAAGVTLTADHVDRTHRVGLALLGRPSNLVDDADEIARVAHAGSSGYRDASAAGTNTGPRLHDPVGVESTRCTGRPARKSDSAHRLAGRVPLHSGIHPTVTEISRGRSASSPDSGSARQTKTVQDDPGEGGGGLSVASTWRP